MKKSIAVVIFFAVVLTGQHLDAQVAEASQNDWVDANYAAVLHAVFGRHTPAGPDPRVSDVRVVVTIVPPGLREGERELYMVLDFGFDRSVIGHAIRPVPGLRQQVSQLHREHRDFSAADIADHINVVSDEVVAKANDPLSHHLNELIRMRSKVTPPGAWVVDGMTYDIQVSRAANIFRYVLVGSADPAATREADLISWAKRLCSLVEQHAQRASRPSH